MSATETRGEQVTTPNGTVIQFQTSPKRQYWVNETPCPSVTEVMDVLGKPLVKWGQDIGVAGVLDLIKVHLLNKRYTTDWEVVVRKSHEDPWQVADVRNVSGLLKDQELDHEAELTRAQNRGTAVHRALEHYIETSEMPDPTAFLPEYQGYVTGLVKFLTDLKIDRRGKTLSEVRVGSATHGYAGTFDLLVKLLPCELNTTPKQKREQFSGWGLLDLKSSSGIYDTHHLQLAAYETAAVECGYRQADFKAVVRVTPDGLYEVKRSNRSLDDFLAVLNVWRVLKGK